jgi:outer membrane protein TolC
LGIPYAEWRAGIPLDMITARLLLSAFLAAVLGACVTPEEALRFADCEAGGAIARKQAEALGASAPFEVAVPANRVRDETVDPVSGLATRPAPLAIDLKGALELAARNSREYQGEKESLYRTALALVNEKVAFRPSPFLNLSSDVTSEGSSDSIGASGELGVTKMLERGGTVLLSAGGDFLRFFTNPTSETAASFLRLVVTLPLFRGAGEDVVLENLRQADRDVIYSVRDLERFKQTFAVQVESQYFRVLAAAQRVENEERNLASLTEARRRNEAFAEAQRITEIEVDQARQNELSAQNRVVVQKNAHLEALDQLKNTLGLPVDLPVHLDDSELETLVKEIDRPFDVPEALALGRGLKLRLDLQNVRDQIDDAQRRIVVAENALESDVTAGFEANPASEDLKPFRVRFEDGRYTAAVDADLALDRRSEAVSLRQAHLDLAEARRSYEAIVEQVKIEIRDALRTLDAARQSYRIQDRAVAVAKRRVESVNEFILRGDASTRDLLESQEALVQAENNLVNALVEFRVAYLNFYRDVGALVVSPEGLNHETSDALLRADS